MGFQRASIWILALALLCSGRTALAQEPATELTEYLENPSYKIRLKAAITIGKQKIRSAGPALRKALNDENDTVKAAAALALGKIGDQLARKDLVGMLEKNSGLPFRAASKALGFLDRSGGARPGFLVVIDDPLLPKGVPTSKGHRVARSLRRTLKAAGTVAFSEGEEKVLQGKKLAQHLKDRKLKGMIVRPKIARLSVKESAGSTTIICKVSVMLVALLNNRMEFAAAGDAEAEVGETGLDPDTIDDVQTQVLDASSKAAAEEVLGYLARRQGP